ncbi:Six-hairpin glycosidase-like protein [Irpex lacteus]|nr:Six-hairpin glycosidase-like protein [Irpex lacteus]
MSRAEQIRGKLFGAVKPKTNGDKPADEPITRSTSDVPLSIHIPKPDPPPVQQAPPPRKEKESKSDSSPKPEVGRESKSFRQRLVEQLGPDYHGAERHRLVQDDKKEVHWKRWGPYVSDRQWATVREDYSSNGDAWSHFPHDHARSRAYRWGEDGLAGISDNHQRLCFGLSLWNGEDHILKERLFGVTGHQGNHGEDVKELYYYLDSTPTHSYMKFLYKYPQKRYPYEELVRENVNRGRDVPEFEILDTDILDEDRYWDVFVEYAKDEQDPDNVYVRITTYNRGPDPATLHIIPQLWFPNTWSWNDKAPPKPILYAGGEGVITTKHHSLGKYHLYCLPSPPPWRTRRGTTYFQTKIHSNTAAHGTAPNGVDETPPSEVEEGPRTPFPTLPHLSTPKRRERKQRHTTFSAMSLLRPDEDPSIEDEGLFDDAIEERREEANEFYNGLVMGPISDDFRQIMRQAFGGMLWTKQFYQFIQKDWMEGDPKQPPPPHERQYIRNRDWKHLYIADILSMPDKWEYPFFAAWDTAFHCIPLAVVDPAFAKKQLDLLTREWYMKPDGQIPAYEWNFGDVNPPVHAWATFRVFKIERKLYGTEDYQFLERVFQKLLLNFTWWVNRKDQDGNNIFEGGFLGLDNIATAYGGTLRQADGTAWMAFYCLNMLNMALELAKNNPVYEDIASKFFEHFIFIADAMTFKTGENEETLWNEEDGMYYDAISFGPGNVMQLPVRSLVGLIPLYATLVLEPSVINRLPGFKKRMEWFIENRPEMSDRNMANMKVKGRGERRLLALMSKERLERVLEKMLDEDEFFSEHGIRSLSKKHKDQPWGIDVHGQRYEVNYWPGDSMSGMFGGNSNWRGPIWLAVNFILIESLQRFYQYYGDEVQVECPTGSGDYMNLANVAEEIQHRIIHIFGRDREGKRAANGGNVKLDRDPHFRDYVWFYEFFHGDDGRGLGASHQTGWSGLVAYHILQSGASCRLPKTPKTPRGIASHYFDETLGDRSEYGGETPSVFSAYSAADLNTLGDISPDAL